VQPTYPDPYDLTGFLDGYDNDLHRLGTKKGFNSLLHGAKAGALDIKNALPKGAKPQDFREAMKAKHPALAEYLDGKKVIGMTLMFRESCILLGCLNKLMAQGIVALPIHDGLLVSLTHVPEAEKAMRSAAFEEVGVELPVQVKDATG
jgi:hypothetical protein